MIFQRTIKNEVRATGVGLHSGEKVNLTLKPAKEDHGIVFKRVDQRNNTQIRVEPNAVIETKLCSTIGNKEFKIATVEHLMSALSASGIDNIIIELSGSEIPIMDGSSSPFVFLIQSAGLVEQEELKKFIKVRKLLRQGKKINLQFLSPTKGL